MPSRAVLQQIASCCAGDLRTAVNQLQFFCQSDRKPGRFSRSSDAQPDTGRDPGLSLFHALGKLLYGKRHKPESLLASDVKIVKSELSAHLANWKRPELTFDLDDVLEQCQMSGDQAISWLHENYIDFMPHMTAINWVCQHVSWADSQLSGGMNWRLGLTPAADWNANEKVSGSARHPSNLATRHYGALVVIRALLLSHNMTEESIASDPSDSRTRPRQGFRPLRAPSVQDSWKVAGQRRDAWCDLGAQCAETFGQLYGFGNFFIANRCRWLYDYLPLAGKLSSIRAYLDKNPSVAELVDIISTFSRSSRPGERRWHSGYNKKPVNISISDGICSPDAISEGDALLIEEDISDSERQ